MRPALTSLDRVMWPAAGVTKGEMLEYYEAVAPVLLPHVAGRPLTLGRFPAGVDGPGFAQTECRGRPDWLRTEPVRLRSGEVRRQCVVDGVDALLWVANLGSIELHAFPSRGADLDEPAYVVFDLDPGTGTGLAECCRVALLVRDALAEAGLRSFAKTSGGLGLHVEVPLAPGHDFDATRVFARQLAAGIAADEPALVTDRRDRAARSGRVLIDWMPNAPRALMVVPYSLRATDVPRVSAPVAWEEIERGDPARLKFGPTEVLERTRRLGDPHRPVLELSQRLPLDHANRS
jgi:bifunctional non-homologous end joining protein LigD